MGTTRIMRVGLILFALTLSVVLAQESHAATYYVRPDGNNSNSGLSWANAWRHPNRTNGAISPGDIVYFAPARYDTVDIRPPRGGTSWTEYRCSSETARSTTILSGAWTLTSGWTSYSGSVYRYNATISPKWNAWVSEGNVTVEQDGTLIQAVGSLSAVNSEGKAYYNSATDQLYLWPWGSANPNGVEVRVSQTAPVRFNYGDQDMILFFGLTIEMGYQTVIALSHSSGAADASDSIWIVHCNIQKVGLPIGASNLSLIGSGLPGGSYPTVLGNMGRFNRVIGCNLDHAWAPDDTYSGGAGLDFYAQREFICDSNWFGPNLRAGGVMFKYGGGGNTIHAYGNVISNNKIMGGRAGIWFGGKQDSLMIYGNEIYNSTYRGIDIHSTTANGPYFGGVRIFNNTLYNCLNGITISPTAQGTNEIRYNIIFDTTGFTRTIEFLNDASEAGSQTPSIENYWNIDQNMYYHGTGSFLMRFSSNSGLTGTNFTAWRAGGFDVNGVNGVNPGFSASHLQELSRPSSSPEINVTYAGKTWTRYGAWQPGGGEPCNAPSSVVLVSPADGATNQSQPLTLDWNDLTDATNYQLQVDNNSNFGSPEVNQNTSSSGYVVTGLAGGVTYYWRVRAQNVCNYGPWTSARMLTTACVAPVAPTLATPADGASGLAQPVALDWADVSGATNYQVQVDDQSAFTSPLVDAQGATSNASVSSLTASTTYYWRVRAQSACGWGNWSVTRSFTSACSTPATPTLVSPANGATGVAKPVVADWGDVSGATNYQIQIDNNSDFSSTLVDQQSATSSYSTSAPVDGIVYYWRVRAQNACGWGSWSSSRTFSTGTPDVVAPTISNVTASEIAENSVVITWTTNEAASTQIDYGPTTSYGSTTTLIPTLVTSHDQLITGLSTMTTYQYRVRSRDGAGNEAVSGNFSFTTANNLANGMMPHVSGTYPGYDSLHLTDGVYDPYGGQSTTWANESATQPHWVEVDLGSARQIQCIAVYWAWNPVQSRWMTSQQFRVQQWNGSSYADVTTVSNATVDSCTFVNITPVMTSRVRYYQPANMGPTTYPTVAWLSELSVFGVTAPTVPTLSIPVGGVQVPSLTPTLTINNSTDVDGHPIVYDFQVSTSSAFTTITAQTTGVSQGAGATTAWVVSTNLVSGTTYYWRSRAYDGTLYSSYSSTGSFVIGVNAAPSVPTLASPAAGASVTSLTPTLTLNNATDPDGNTITYDFQVSTASNFATIAAQVSGRAQGSGGVTSWSVSPSLVNGTTYYWRVRAFDGALYSSYSGSRTFVVSVNLPPNSPSPNSPANGGRVIDLTPDLIVNNATDPNGDALSYQFELYNYNGTTLLSQSSLIGQGSSTTFWTVPFTLNHVTRYNWRARAYDGAAYSSWTSLRNFRTNRVPLAPTPISPANGDTIYGSVHVYTVSNSTDPDGDSLTYEFEVYADSALTILVEQQASIVQGVSFTSALSAVGYVNNQFYWWRARANDSTHTSAWCPTQKFYQRETLLDVTDAPNADSPAPGAEERTVTPTFKISWVGSADSSKCTFEVARDLDFDFLVAAGEVSALGNSAQWVPDHPLQEGAYYWRAKRSESDYSQANAFTIAAPVFLSPNPFVYDADGVTVHNLPEGSRFEVYSPSEDKVYEQGNLSGEYVWDGRNSIGEKLGSGVFLWYVRYQDKTISGKLIVVR